MNTYLILGASEFTYEGNTTEKQSDGIRIIVKGQLDGYYIYLQDVNTSEFFKLILTEDVIQVDTPERKYNLWRYDYYAYWKLEECDYTILDEIEYVPRLDSYIILPKTQEKLPNIIHELFNVSYEGDNHRRQDAFQYKQGECMFYEDKWKRIKKEFINS
jgi:hypothetical protein